MKQLRTKAAAGLSRQPGGARVRGVVARMAGGEAGGRLPACRASNHIGHHERKAPKAGANQEGNKSYSRESVRARVSGPGLRESMSAALIMES